MKRTTHHGKFFLQPTDAVLSHNSPKAASKRPKKIFRCTVFCVCFSAASCKRRLRKVFTWKFFFGPSYFVTTLVYMALVTGLITFFFMSVLSRYSAF